MVGEGILSKCEVPQDSSASQKVGLAIWQPLKP